MSYPVAAKISVPPRPKEVTPEYLNVEKFKDVEEKTAYFYPVQYLKSEGIAKGYEDNTFRPFEKIKRADFLKMVMQAGHQKAEGKNCYKDVKNEWFAPYICAAKKLKFISGFPDGTFRPEDNIRFSEASKIISKVLGLKVGKRKKTWFQPYVDALAKNFAIPITVDSFDKELTRGEMAQMIWKIQKPEDAFGAITQTYASIQFFQDKSSADLEKLALSQEGMFLVFEKLDIALAPNEILKGFSKKLSKEIKIYSLMMNAAYSESEAEMKMLHVRKYKGIAFLTHPKTHMYAVFPDPTKIFEVIGESPEVLTNMIFVRADKGIFQFVVEENLMYFVPFESLDPETFSQIYHYKDEDFTLFKDKNHVYYAKEGELYILDDIDSDSFVLFDVAWEAYPEYAEFLFKDKNSIYYFNRDQKFLLKSKSADIKSFVRIDRKPYFKDKNFVYFFNGNELLPLDNADPETFDFDAVPQ